MKWLFAALLTVVCWWERARLRLKRILCSVRATTLANLAASGGDRKDYPWALSFSRA